MFVHLKQQNKQVIFSPRRRCGITTTAGVQVSPASSAAAAGNTDYNESIDGNIRPRTGAVLFNSIVIG